MTKRKLLLSAPHQFGITSRLSFNIRAPERLSSLISTSHQNTLFPGSNPLQSHAYSTISFENPTPKNSQIQGSKNYSVVILDVETSGRSHDNDHLLEIAAIKLKDGITVGQYSTLLRVENLSIAPELTQVHGITDRMMSKGIELHLALKMLDSFMEDGSVLIAHNASFDTKFLEVAYQRSGMTPRHDQVLCTLNLSRRLLDVESYTLSNLAQHLGMILPKSSTFHRAMTDTRCTALIWKHLYQKGAEMLGWYPDLDFFHGLTKVSKKSVPNYVKRYIKKHGHVYGVSADQTLEEEDGFDLEQRRPKDDPYAEIPFLKTDYRFSTAHLEEDPNTDWQQVRTRREQKL